MLENGQNGMLKTFKSKIFAVAIAAALVVAILAVGISAVINSDPMAQVSKAIKNSADALSSGEAYSKLYDASEGGSIEFYWNMEELLEQFSGVGVDLGVNFKMFMNSKNSTVAANLAASFEGEELVGATVHLDPEKLVAKCPALLGDKSYGINIDKLSENFENSVFGEDGAYSLGIEAEQLEYIQSYVETIESSADMEKDVQKIYKDLFTVLSKSIKKNGVVSKDSGSISFAGESVKTNEVIIKIDSKALVAIVEDVLKHLDDNKSIERLLEKYYDLMNANYAAYDMDYSIDADELLDEYRQGISDALDSIDELEDEIEDVEIEIVLSISKSGKELVGVDVSVEADGEELAIELICGPTWKNISEFNLTIDDGYEKVEVVYEVEENTKQAFEAAAEISVDNETVGEATLSWDKKAGDFELAVSDAYEELFELEGALLIERKKMTVLLDSITTGGQRVEFGEIGITVNAADKMPSAGKYSDVLTMDEDEIEGIISDVQDAVSELDETLASSLQ